MRASDVKNLVRFNTRMGMFVCPCHRQNVVAFLHGYEFGTGTKCAFTKALSDNLHQRHRIKPGSLGWPNQIERLAEKLSLDWMEVYLLVSSEVLQSSLEPRKPKRRLS